MQHTDKLGIGKINHKVIKEKEITFQENLMGGIIRMVEKSM